MPDQNDVLILIAAGCCGALHATVTC